MIEYFSDYTKISAKDLPGHRRQRINVPFEVEGELGVGEALPGVEGGARRGGLNLVEGSHHDSGLRRAIIVGVDHIASEVVFLRTPL